MRVGASGFHRQMMSHRRAHHHYAPNHHHHRPSPPSLPNHCPPCHCPPSPPPPTLFRCLLRPFASALASGRARVACSGVLLRWLCPFEIALSIIILRRGGRESTYSQHTRIYGTHRVCTAQLTHHYYEGTMLTEHCYERNGKCA